MNERKQPAVSGRRAGAAAMAPNPDIAHFATRIERAVARQPLDQVRCIHLFDGYYRCNWWAPLGADGHRNQAMWIVGAMSRVRRSCFVSATLDNGRLVIEEIKGDGTRSVLAIDAAQGTEEAFAQTFPVDSVAKATPEKPGYSKYQEDDEGEALL